jgi:septin family protein
MCVHLQFVDIEEGGVSLRLAVIETAGYGDQLDKDKRCARNVDHPFL